MIIWKQWKGQNKYLVPNVVCSFGNVEVILKTEQLTIVNIHFISVLEFDYVIQ